MKWLSYALCLSMLALVIGCSSSPYVDGYYFSPRPLVADIPATQPSQPPPVAAYATVVGIRNEDDKLHVPESVEVRLRIDNNGPDSVLFDPRSMELNTGDLFRFPPPQVASSPVALMPGESGFVTAFFPFTPGHDYDNIDLGSLQLRWAVQIGQQRFEQIGNFQQVEQRVIYYRDDPYARPYYGPGPYGGVVVVHRR